MDIYSFLNSRDIAEHCRKIQKEWSPPEMALIISNSNRPRSISDKHEAWRDLISDYPDMPVPPVPDCYFSRGFDSLHEILLSRIAYEERVMQCFMEPAPTAVYRHRVMWSGQWDYSESIYTSFQKAWNDAVDSWDRDETPEIIVDKIFPNDEGCISICFDYDQRVLDIDSVSWEGIRRDDYMAPGADFFLDDTCCVDIPTPFQIGDILTIPAKSKHNDDFIFVVRPIDGDEKERRERYKKWKYYDNTDANHYWGYSVSDTGVLGWCDIMGGDCAEYYRGKYGGAVAILHYVSLYLKGKLPLPELLTMQCRTFLKCEMDLDLRYDTLDCRVTDDLLAENQLTEEEKGGLVKNRGVMPWVEGKLSFAQVEWLAEEFKTSTELVQKMLVYGVSQYGGSCAGIVHDEDHYEKTGDARFNPARRAMARMFLEAYGYTQKGWTNKHESGEEVD